MNPMSGRLQHVPAPTFGYRSDRTTPRAGRLITTSKIKSAWLQALALLSPVIVLAILSATPYTRSGTIRFSAKNWGNVASAWGLGVSIYVLYVAKGARCAAEEARSEERLKTALAGIEDAADKNNQVGQFARVQKWDVVELRALEVLACCRTTLAAWGDSAALTDSRRNLNDIANQMLSIVEESRSDNPNRKTIFDAQLRSHEKLAVIVGKIQKGHRSGLVR